MCGRRASSIPTPPRSRSRHSLQCLGKNSRQTWLRSPRRTIDGRESSEGVCRRGKRREQKALAEELLEFEPGIKDCTDPRNGLSLSLSLSRAPVARPLLVANTGGA